MGEGSMRWLMPVEVGVNVYWNVVTRERIMAVDRGSIRSRRCRSILSWAGSSTSKEVMDRVVDPSREVRSIYPIYPDQAIGRWTGRAMSNEAEKKWVPVEMMT
jgi:hypothetical protein